MVSQLDLRPHISRSIFATGTTAVWDVSEEIDIFISSVPHLFRAGTT